MSNSEKSGIGSVKGLFQGILVLIAGLALTIGQWGPGAMLGLPLVVLGLIIPVGMTYNAQTESKRKAARRRPEHDSSAAYEIETKGYKERRTR